MILLAILLLAMILIFLIFISKDIDLMFHEKANERERRILMNACGWKKEIQLSARKVEEKGRRERRKIII